MILLAFLMFLARAIGPPAPAVSPTTTSANRFAEPTRGILAQHCGSCHLPNLPTSVPGALAIFNLAEEPWFGRLTRDQYDMLVRRVSGMGDVPAPDKAIVESFVQCARDGTCAAAAQ